MYWKVKIHVNVRVTDAVRNDYCIGILRIQVGKTSTYILYRSTFLNGLFHLVAAVQAPAMAVGALTVDHPTRDRRESGSLGERRRVSIGPESYGRASAWEIGKLG